MKKKITYLLLLIFFSCSVLIEGCGCGKKTDGENADGEQPAAENAEGGETPPQEVARTNTPAPAAPAAAPAAPPRPNTPAGKQPQAADKGPKIKTKPIPKDRFLQIEFDTKEAGLIPVMQTYMARVRRNIFRDIKSSVNLRKLAEEAISTAKKEIQLVKKLPAGTISEPLIKQAEENLKQAEEAFKSQNYLKARAVAEKSTELAANARPKAENQTVSRGMDYFYKGFYQMGEQKTGMLTRRNLEDDSESLLMVTVGQKIEEKLSGPLTIENPDGSQQKVYKREYLIEEITEDNILMTNLTEPKKPPVKIPVTRGETASASKDSKDSKDNKSKDNKGNTDVSKQQTQGSKDQPKSSGTQQSGVGTSASYNSNATKK